MIILQSLGFAGNLEARHKPKEKMQWTKAKRIQIT